MKKMGLVAVAFATGLCVQGGVESDWDLTKTTGFYDAAENWSRGVPFGGTCNGDTTVYGVIPRAANSALDLNNNNLTIKIPANGYVDSSSTLTYGVPSGYSRDVIFDARGTWWEKHGTNIEFAVISNPSTSLTSGHVFRMELHNTSAVLPLFRLTDGVLRVHSDGAGSDEVHLDSGTWDFLTPGGVTLAKPTNIYLGYGKGMHMHLHENSSFIGNIHIHSINDNNRLFVDGGDHRIQTLEVASSSSWGNYEPRAEIYGDAEVAFGGIYLGVASKTPPCVGRLCVSNTAALTVDTGIYFSYGGRTGTTGILDMYDESVIDARCVADLGLGESSTGIVHMADCSNFKISKTLYLARAVNSCAAVTLEDNARFESSDSIYVSSVNKDTHASIALSGNAVFSVKHHVMLSTKENSVSELSLDGASKFDVNGILQLGQETSGTATINLSENSSLNVGESIQVRTLASNPALISLADNATITIPEFDSRYSGVWNLAANGGTIVIPASDSEVLIPACASAVIGAGGLTLAAHSDVVVAPSFSGEGTLTVAGSGKVTLTGASTHANTLVPSGIRFELGDGASLGGTLTLQTNAVLNIPANTSVSVARIRAEGGAALYVNANSSIALTEVVGDDPVTIVVDDASAVAGQTYPIITFPSGQDADVSKFYVANRTTGREYALSANGSTISLTMAEVTAGKTLTYVGTDGMWGAASNWSDGNGGSGVPTINDDVIIPAAAAGREITISTRASAASLTIEADVTLTGDNLLHLGEPDGLSILSGKVNMAVPLSVKTPFVVNTAAGSTTTVSRAFSSYGQAVRFEKTGSGALVVAGDNRDFNVDWILLRGKTTFVGQNAFGMDTVSETGLVLSNNTVRYEGDAATITRPVKIAGGYPAVFETVGDLTFKSFAITPGTTNCCFTKIGKGRLMFEIPVGETILTTFTDGGEKRAAGNALSDWGKFELPENGEITSWNGVGQMNILEGTLHIKGQGASSKVKNKKNTLVGGSQYDAETAPELVLEDVDAATGSSGFVTVVARKMLADTAQPKVTVVDSTWTEDTLYLAYDRFLENGVEISPTFAVTNSTVTFTWALSISEYGKAGPTRTNLKPNVFVGGNSSIIANMLNIGDACTVDIAEGSKITVKKNNGYTCYSHYRPVEGASITYHDGVVLDARIFTMYNPTANSPALIGVDGATIRLGGGDGLASGCNRPETDGFNAMAGGMCLDVPSGVTHLMGMAIHGEGLLTKVGSGTIVFPQSYTVNDGSNNFGKSEPATGKVLRNEGGLNVAEGVAVIHAGAATNTYDVAVASGAELKLNGEEMTLGSVSGAGTISDGTLSAAILAGADVVAPTFSNITLNDMRVDLQISDGERCPKFGTEYTVANFGANVTANVGGWKGVNVGEGGKLEFSLVDGRVVAKVKSTSGMVLIVR